jgi:hypothetical protein
MGIFPEFHVDVPMPKVEPAARIEVSMFHVPFKFGTRVRVDGKIGIEGHCYGICDISAGVRGTG